MLGVGSNSFVVTAWWQLVFRSSKPEVLFFCEHSRLFKVFEHDFYISVCVWSEQPKGFDERFKRVGCCIIDMVKKTMNDIKEKEHTTKYVIKSREPHYIKSVFSLNGKEAEPEDSESRIGDFIPSVERYYWIESAETDECLVCSDFNNAERALHRLEEGVGFEDLAEENSFYIVEDKKEVFN